MARYDFLDEETRKKLEGRQKRMITQKKKDEVKRKKEGRKDKESKGPRVYTTENGKIGGVIYPEDRKESSKPSEQIMGKEKKEKKGNPGCNPEDDLPIKLHHTKNTRVGTENRPKPPRKEDLEGEEKRKENTEEENEAVDKIWQ